METLRLALDVPDEFCCICTKVPKTRLVLDVVVEGQATRVSICRDCLAEYAPETLAAIEEEAGFGG